MAKVYSNRLSAYTHENGGRVLLLFLLFLLAIYEFIDAGFAAFTIICLIPSLILAVYVLFRWKTSAFWLLIVVNYFLQMKGGPIPSGGGIPMSIYDEMLELVLLAIAIIDARQTPHFERCANMMLFAIFIWSGYCCLQLFNDTCSLGINVSAWFTSFRLMALHLVWICLVFCIYVTTPKILLNYLRLWAILSLFSAYWTWKQINIGFSPTEQLFLNSGGDRTHILNAGTLIRYFSTFSDAATYGCNAAASSVTFFIIAITSKITWERIFFALVGACVVWGMFQSGTRTAIFCIAAGFIVYIFLSKSIKIAVPFSIFFVLFMCMLVFTNIGNSNQQIRRMRSAFDKSDASANTRDINKTAIRKYLQDAPWGLGIASNQSNIPTNNKYRKLSDIPPDSEYVYIWVHTGVIGITVFLICMLIMFIGGCWVVMFKLRSPSLIGIGAGLCCSFVAIQLGAYANQILYQYPNGLTFFGGLAIVYTLPYIEPAWIEWEKQRLAKVEERKRIKIERKLASRV
jgi:hypothetical protein